MDPLIKCTDLNISFLLFRSFFFRSCPWIGLACVHVHTQPKYLSLYTFSYESRFFFLFFLRIATHCVKFPSVKENVLSSYTFIQYLHSFFFLFLSIALVALQSKKALSLHTFTHYLHSFPIFFFAFPFIALVALQQKEVLSSHTFTHYAHSFFSFAFLPIALLSFGQKSIIIARVHPLSSHFLVFLSLSSHPLR